MRSNVQYRLEAIRLRKQGKSYREIMTKVPVAKSTLSKWFQFIPLTKKEERFIKERMLVLQDKGRMKVALTNKDKNEKRRDVVRLKAKIDFQKYKADPFFVLGLALYWGSGTQKSNYFSFSNADPEMIKIMMQWACKFLLVEPADYRFRLFVQKSHERSQFERYWSRSCAIPRSQFQKTVYTPGSRLIITDPQYKGSLRMVISGIDRLITVHTWQNLLSAYYGEA